MPSEGGPLTTVFYPPSGCFDAPPGTWTSCFHNDHFSVSVNAIECYWSLPRSCYPTGASTEKLTRTNIPIKLHYSPGVLPSGFVTARHYEEKNVVIGCPSGWTVAGGAHDWPACKSKVQGNHQVPHGTDVTSGEFYGVLPHIEATWSRSDLAEFTPASAPILPPAVIKAWTEAHRPASPHSGLSTGVQAGIAVGVTVLVLGVLLGLLLVLVRRKHKQRIAQYPEGVTRELSEEPDLSWDGSAPKIRGLKEIPMESTAIPEREPREFSHQSDKPKRFRKLLVSPVSSDGASPETGPVGEVRTNEPTVPETMRGERTNLLPSDGIPRRFPQGASELSEREVREMDGSSSSRNELADRQVREIDGWASSPPEMEDSSLRSSSHHELEDPSLRSTPNVAISYPQAPPPIPFASKPRKDSSGRHYA